MCEDELYCDICGAKLTGEEGMNICIPCQEEDPEIDEPFEY